MQTVSLEKYEAKDIHTRMEIPYMRLTRQIFDPQIRRQMGLGTDLYYEKSILGCGLGWTVKKKVWADYEQLLRPIFLSFHGQKIQFENIVGSALKSCIE